MTTHPTRLYRPLLAPETAANGGCNVGFFSRCADNLNNWHTYVGNYPLTYIWPVDNVAFTGATEVATDGTAAEKFMLYFGKLYVDRAYPLLRIYLHGRTNAGAAGPTTAWIVYASTNLYTGPDLAFDSSYLHDSVSASFSVATPTWNIYTDTLPITTRDHDGCIYLCLTALDASAPTKSSLISATLQPVFA